MSCSEFSQLSNSEIFFFEYLSTIDNVTICSAMSSFFGPPCRCESPEEELTALSLIINGTIKHHCAAESCVCCWCYVELCSFLAMCVSADDDAELCDGIR